MSIFAVSNKKRSKMKKRIISFAVVAIAAAAGWVFNTRDYSKLMNLSVNTVDASAYKCATTAGSCWLDDYYECCDAGNVGCSPCGE